MEFTIIDAECKFLKANERPRRKRKREKNTASAERRESVAWSKRLDKVTQESRERFLSLAEETGVPIVAIDPKGRFIHANEATSSLLGYSRDELLRRPFGQFLHPNDKARILRLFAKIILLRRPLRKLEFRVIRKDGSIRYVWSKPTRLVVGGQKVGFQAIMVDVTERKQMQEEIENLARFPLENPNPVLRIRKDGVILHANPASKALLRSWKSKVGDAVPDLWRRIVADAYMSQSRRNADVELGKVIYLVTVVPVKDAGYVNFYGRDITERKRMEEALQESEQKFRDITERSIDAICTMDLEGRLTYISPAAKAITGYEPEELIEKTKQAKILGFISGPEAEKAIQAFSRLAKGERIEPAEFEVVRKDGSLVCVEVNTVPVIKDGRVTGFEGIVRDITERKKMERRLRESEENLQSFIDAVQNNAYVIDAEGTILLANQWVANRFGKPLDQVIGSCIYDLLPSHLVEHRRAQIDSVIRSGRPVAFESVRGEEYFDYRLFPIFGLDGRVTKVAILGIDITGRKRMETESRERREELQTILDSMSAMVFYKDEKNRFVRVNRAFADAKGCSPESLVGRSSFEVSPKHAEDYWRDDKEVIATGQAKRNIIEIFETVKGTRWIQTDKVPYRDPQGNTIGVIGFSVDITERKRMEEALKRSEERFRQVFRFSPIPYLITLPEGPIVDANNAWVRMSGYSREEAVGRSTVELGMVPDPEQRHQLVRDLLQKRRLSDVEITRRTKSGELRDLLNSPELVEIAGQTCILNMQIDITERKRSQREILRLNRYLESIIDNANVWLDVLDERANVVIWNKAAEAMSGYSREEVVGHSKIWGWLYPDEEYRNAITARAAAIIEKGEVEENFETTIKHKDGRARVISWHSRNLVDEEGHPIGSIALGRDVTEQKLMEKELERHAKHLEELVEERTGALQESEKRFREFADLLPQIVYEIDEKGNFTFVNQAGMEIAGYSREDLSKGLNALQMFAPEDRNRVRENMRRRLGGELSGAVEYLAMRKDGTTFPVMNYGNIIFRDNKPVGLRGITVDITERKDLERMKDQLNQALLEDVVRRQETERMRDRFVSAITHELRTPLVSIKGYMDLVFSEPGRISGDVESELQVVKRNTDRLLSLTDDLLDIQRMQAGRLQLDLKPTDLKEVIEHCVAEIRPFINDRKQSLTLEIPDAALPVYGDPVRLSQVLVNLLSNACKFTPESGAIVLRAKEDNDIIQVQISDTGIGIKPEDLARVFEPFTTIEKPSYIKGTGLGLSVTKGLVEAHGGKIWAKSEGEGKGATFTLTLPKKQSP